MHATLRSRFLLVDVSPSSVCLVSFSSLSLSLFLSLLTCCTSWLHGERDTTRSLGIATRASGTLDSSMGPQNRNPSRCSRFSFLSVQAFPLFDVQKYTCKEYTRGEFVAGRGTRIGLTLHRCSIAICNVRGQLSRDRICLSTRLADGGSSDDKGSKVFAPENCHSRGKSFEERPRFVCFRATRKNGGLPVGKLLSLGIFTTVHLRS